MEAFSINCLPFFISDLLKRLPKYLPVHYLIKLFKRITVFVQLLKSLMPVKKTCLHHCFFLSIPLFIEDYYKI